MNQPLVTIITVAYNALEALKQTAASTLAQDYRNTEYIIVDGASTDGTKEWLEEINDARITASQNTEHTETSECQNTEISEYRNAGIPKHRNTEIPEHRNTGMPEHRNERIPGKKLNETQCHVRWISEPDKGIYDAMNKGVKMASGEYCIFMNAGDTFVDEHVISKIFAEADEKTDIIYGDIMKNGQLKGSLSPRNCHKMFYCHQGVFTRTSCLRDFPFDIKHRYSADFKQAKQLFLAGKCFQYINMPVANFDTNGVSNTQRSKGLWDNVKVVCEVDSFKDKCRFLPHLLFPWLMCKLRGK